jgi:transglutaminase-like putative cysteine protease
MMHSRRALLIQAGMLAAAFILHAEDFSRTFSIAEPAAWVMQAPQQSLAEPTKGRDDSEVCMLADYQANVAAEELYVRIVSKLLTSEGVQSGSTVMVDYDPAYQTLVFHHIRVIRGGTAASRLSRETVSLLRRETDIEWSMLDGTVTASTVLKDVKPGDIVDYAYTVRGRNPVLGGKFTDFYTIGWTVAVGRERIRVLCPSSRKLRYRTVGGTAEPRTESSRGMTEYEWEISDIAPVIEEDRTPSWYVSYPWIEVSEFEDWAEVGRWALALYPQAALPAGLEALAAEWSGKNGSAAPKLEAALDFVQQEIRYVGIELGEGSHKPRDPATVFAQRFGDCKDKAYLLCTLLRRMGIEAHPVLVDTYSRAAVADRLPSPYNFNHVIAAVNIGEKRVFVDPTEAYQRGPVLERFVPDYGYGLLIAAGQSGLVRFGSHQGKASEIEIVEKFTAKGQEEPALLEVETTASGTAAEDLRAAFAGNRVDEMAKNYLDYYAASYPKIEYAGDLDVRDNTNTNVFTTVERYNIPGFWTLLTDKRNYRAEFFAQSVYDQIPVPRTKNRASPFALAHPVKFHERIEVILPEPWPVSAEKSSIETAAFELAIERTSKDSLIVLDFKYASLADEVSVSEVPAYNEAIKDIDEELGYNLTWQAESAAEAGGPIDASVLTIVILCALLLAVGGFGLYRMAAKPAADAQAQAPPYAQPAGLGGWLILAAAGLAASIVACGGAIWNSRFHFSTGSWYDLTNPAGARYDAVWWPYLLFVLVSNLAIIAGATLLLVLFLQKRRRFPAFYIVFLAFSGASVAADAVFAGALSAFEDVGSDLPRAITQVLISIAVWVPYMLTSQRVKNTFVR